MSVAMGPIHLYALTLQRSSAITAAVFGNFSAARQQELAVARGKLIELLRPNANGKVLTVAASEVFGNIRSIATFRLTGGNRDYLVVGSDSGRCAATRCSAAWWPGARCYCCVHARSPGMARHYGAWRPRAVAPSARATNHNCPDSSASAPHKLPVWASEPRIQGPPPLTPAAPLGSISGL